MQTVMRVFKRDDLNALAPSPHTAAHESDVSPGAGSDDAEEAQGEED